MTCVDMQPNLGQCRICHRPNPCPGDADCMFARYAHAQMLESELEAAPPPRRWVLKAALGLLAWAVVLACGSLLVLAADTLFGR